MDLTDFTDPPTTPPIVSFSGEWSFLSNFYPSLVRFEGVEYRTVEHAYQASKTFNLEEREKIKNCLYPGQAKRAGRRVTIRPDWDDVKVRIMYDLVRQKFNQLDLQDKLLATGDAELIEGNTWGDRFWGQCPLGVGRNELGRILMDVRSTLRSLTL